MRSKPTVLAIFLFGLAVTPCWGQLRLPDLGTNFLEDTKDPAVAASEKKKRSEEGDKSAEKAEKATDFAITTHKTTGSFVEFSGDAATVNKTLEIPASTTEVIKAHQKDEAATEVANQVAEKVVGGVGKLVGGELGEKVIGASYKVTKSFLEDTKPGQWVDEKRDNAYLAIGGAFDPKPRTGEQGPEAYEAHKLERSMKNAGLIGASDTVPGFEGLNTGPDKRSTTATSARIGSNGGIDLMDSARKAGLNTDASTPHKILVNTEAVTKLLGPAPSPAKNVSRDPAALQASLDYHVADWKRKEEERKAAEKRRLAEEAEERERDYEAMMQLEAERDAQSKAEAVAAKQAHEDRVIAMQANQLAQIAAINQQRRAIAYAQWQAAQNAEQPSYYPYTGGGSSSATAPSDAKSDTADAINGGKPGSYNTKPNPDDQAAWDAQKAKMDKGDFSGTSTSTSKTSPSD